MFFIFQVAQKPLIIPPGTVKKRIAETTQLSPTNGNIFTRHNSFQPQELATFTVQSVTTLILPQAREVLLAMLKKQRNAFVQFTVRV